MTKNDQLILKNRLRIGRAKWILTQEKLAQLVGVSRKKISAIESRQFNPTSKLVLIICVALER